MVTLNVKKRAKGSGAELRKKGEMPAVFYGKKEESTSISVKLTDFVKVLDEAGESTVITLKGGEIGEKDALVYAVDLDPVTNIPRHADFYVFEAGKKIEIKVALEFVGVAPAVKEMGGTLVKVLHEIAVEAEPKNLPHKLEVDISGLLNFESQILAKDIKLPTGVSLIEKPEQVVALAEEIKEEVEEVTVAPDLSAIEVEKKGKKEEEGEGEAAAAPKAEKKEENKK